jgi:hypothetical protein
MLNKPKTEIPWGDLGTIFELKGLDAEANSYTAPLTFSISATRPINHPDEVLPCAQGISQLSGLIAKLMDAEEARAIELDSEDFLAVEEILEIIRILSLRLEQWAWIQCRAKEEASDGQ